jgi:hypothetical protein
MDSAVRTQRLFEAVRESRALAAKAKVPCLLLRALNSLTKEETSEFGARHSILNRPDHVRLMAHVAELFRPVVELMAHDVRRSRMIHTDATNRPYLDSESAPGRALSG